MDDGVQGRQVVRVARLKHSRNVQTQVARALQEMVGMEVGEVEIHIEDIEYEETEAKPA